MVARLFFGKTSGMVFTAIQKYMRRNMIKMEPGFGQRMVFLFLRAPTTNISHLVPTRITGTERWRLQIMQVVFLLLTPTIAQLPTIGNECVYSISKTMAAPRLPE